MGLYRGPKIVRDGLVVALDAGGTRSYPGTGSVWTDLSGNNNDGTLIGTVFNNGFLEFSASPDYVNGITVGSENIKTVSCWFTLDDGLALGVTLFGFGTGAANTQDVYMWNTGEFGFNNWNSDSWGISNGHELLENNGWHQVVAEFHFDDFTENKMWIDANLLSLSQVKGTTLQRTLSTNFGIAYNGWQTANQMWQGNIATLLVYNKALTDIEIAQNYHAHKSRFI
jgi:hypothetical protein